MKSFARILIVWLALLAVPFQGFAAAAALGCAHGTAYKPMATMEHSHACHHHDAAKGGQHDGKCSNCATCCAGAAIAPPALTMAGLPPAATHHLIGDAGAMPSFQPDHPERPPRFARA